MKGFELLSFKNGFLTCDLPRLWGSFYVHVRGEHSLFEHLRHPFVVWTLLLKREAGVIPSQGGVSTLVSSFQPSPRTHAEENAVWPLAPFSTTLPGFAEADSQDWQELQTGHLDAFPLLYTLSFISAAFTEIRLC